MTGITSFLGLKTYDTGATDGSGLFQTFRTDIDGPAANSNMNLIDGFASSTSASLIALNARGGVISASAAYISANYYEINGLTTFSIYTNNIVLALRLDTTSNGTVTLNINGAGTRSLQKVNGVGSLINLSGSDLQKNKEYLFRYNGTVWIWIDSTSQDQISIAGNANEIVTLSGSGIQTSGSTFANLAPSNANYLVSSLNPILANESQLIAGSGISLITNSSASTISINNQVIAGSNIFINNNTSSSIITIGALVVTAGCGISVANSISASTITVGTLVPIAGSNVFIVNNTSASTVTIGTLVATAGNGISITNSISASTITVAGLFSGSTETTAGSSTITMVNPSSLAHSDYGKANCFISLNTTVALVGGETNYIRIPSKLNGYNIVSVAASCSGSSTSGSPVFTVKNGTTSMLTTNLMIDQGEVDSLTSGCAAVIDTAHDEVATGNKIWVTNIIPGTNVTYSGVELGFQLP